MRYFFPQEIESKRQMLDKLFLAEVPLTRERSNMGGSPLDVFLFVCFFSFDRFMTMI